jgi:hypothetical protein
MNCTKLPLLFCFVLVTLCTQAQSVRDSAAAKKHLLRLNRLLDQAVVDKNAAFLQKHYAEDFYFKHGTGLIDSKRSWMKNVLDTAAAFHSRSHDSVFVEWHGNVAVLAGTLTVKRRAGTKLRGYGLRYIRVYGYRKKVWQLLSHRTIQEWHLPDMPL